MPSVPNWRRTIVPKHKKQAPSGALHTLRHDFTVAAQPCFLVAVVLLFQPVASYWKGKELKYRLNLSALNMILWKKTIRRLFSMIGHQLKPYYNILNNTKDRELEFVPFFLTEVDFQNRIMIFQPSIKIL